MEKGEWIFCSVCGNKTKEISSLIPYKYGNRCDYQIQNGQNHKEPYIRLQKHINDIKSKVQQYRINQIIMPFQKDIHQNGHAGNDDNIGNDIGDCPPVGKF